MKKNSFELARKIELEVRKYKYRYGKPKNTNTTRLIARLLIVKNVNYVQISLNCILSFLHYHPNSQVEIYCDNETIISIRKFYSRELTSGKVTINRLVRAEESWQAMKLELMSSINLANCFYMDADLRWNAPMPILESPTFYVNEFVLGDRSPYREMLKEIGTCYLKSTMKNTSFYFPGDFRLSESEIADLFALHGEINTVVNSGVVGKVDRATIGRISEQLAISLASEKWRTDIGFLKDEDAHKDGSFLESSYYGATGQTF